MLYLNNDCDRYKNLSTVSIDNLMCLIVVSCLYVRVEVDFTL